MPVRYCIYALLSALFIGAGMVLYSACEFPVISTAEGEVEEDVTEENMPAAVQIGQYHYLIGGSDASGEPSARVQRADMRQEVPDWVDEPELPAGRVGAATAAVGRALYVIGGEGPDGAADTVWFAVVNDDGSLRRWHELSPPLIAARTNLTARQHDGRIYLVDGYCGDEPCDQVWYTRVREGRMAGNWYIADAGGDQELPAEQSLPSGVADLHPGSGSISRNQRPRVILPPGWRVEGQEEPGVLAAITESGEYNYRVFNESDEHVHTFQRAYRVMDRELFFTPDREMTADGDPVVVAAGEGPVWIRLTVLQRQRVEFIIEEDQRTVRLFEDDRRNQVVNWRDGVVLQQGMYYLHVGEVQEGGTE